MLDILVALLFVGMVAIPAVLAAMPRNESAKRTEKPGGSLTPALAVAKQGRAVAASASSSRS